MSPKEYAEVLVDKFIYARSKKMDDYSSIEFPTAKICALIAVDEILKSPTPKQEKYWKLVRNEIEKL
jgi:hypothetical protein